MRNVILVLAIMTLLILAGFISWLFALNKTNPMLQKNLKVSSGDLSKSSDIPINEYQKLYSDVKDLYDKSEYTKCIDESSKIIQTQEKLLLETKNYLLLANLYELRADCLERKVDIEEAVGVIQVLLSKLEMFLPNDYLARLKLKIGHIYKSAGLYSKALSNFKKVKQEYKKTFPNRFAKYAQENYNDILSKQVATIRGKVFLEDNEDYSAVTIKVFNGFEESETKALSDGKYSLPLFCSTQGTSFSLFAYKRGYSPTIMNIPFKGGPDIAIGEIQLKRLNDNKETGVIAGVVYIPVSGGKLKPTHGLAGFKTKYKIKLYKILDNSKTYETESDGEGIFIVLLPTGPYRINDGKKDKVIKLDKKEVVPFNISAGEVLID